MNRTDPIDVASRYLRAIETRAPLEALGALLHEDVVIEVLPNRLDPRGSRSTRAQALAAAERGRALMREERYEVTSAMGQGERAVLEVVWTGVLAVPLGTLAAGAVMRARSSMHFELRDGRIAAQRNYDCFDAW